MLRQVLDRTVEALAAGQSVIYTALVETRGSTPQKAGASMVVFPDGSQAGTLGGGCVEAEVKRRALTIQQQSAAELMTFQLDNDYGWDDGLICGGRMTMLVDPLQSPTARQYYQTFRHLLEMGDGGTEAIALDSQENPIPPGTRFLFDANGKLIATTADPAAISENVSQHLKPLAERPRPYIVEGLSYLPHLPRCRLVIVGAGHVGQQVAQLAADCDFDCWVIDDRDDYCNAQRFPRAQRCLVGPIEETLRDLPVDANTFCIIVTRGHHHDEQALFWLARTPARYVGMIGSKRKIRLIFDDLLREGIPEADLERVHAPLGLDIGSQTVPEIAVSIVAELIACRNLPTSTRGTGSSRAV